jgi:hypothetical protein
MIQTLFMHADPGEMTPFQELLNAASMAAPSALLVWRACGEKGYLADPRALAVAVSTFIHFPVSANYHFRCALRLDRARLHTRAHLADQISNFTVCATWACAMCTPWTSHVAVAALSVFNSTMGVSYMILHRHWERTAVKTQLAAGTLAYVALIATTPQSADSALAVVFLLSLAAVLFLFSAAWFGGNGHALAHVVAAPVPLFLITIINA